MSRLPWEHPFQPDPLTPTACVICALHPQWHSRPLLYDDPASVERLGAALRRLVAAIENARVAADDALDRAGSAADAFEQGTMRPDALDELHDAEDAARAVLAALTVAA